MERKKNIIPAAVFLTIIYTVGRFGLSNEMYGHYFKNLTWLNLTLTAIITFYYHQNWNKSFIVKCLIIFLSGYLVELIGVRTGIIFGNYKYGNTMGFKILEIPLLIGVNWLVLIYCVHNVLLLLKLEKWIFVFLGAFFLVLLDYFLEPFAMRFDLWNWENDTVPFKNYIAWFIISAILLLTLKSTGNKTKPNYLAAFVYGLQLFFFLSFAYS